MKIPAADPSGFVVLWRKVVDNYFLMNDDNAMLVFIKLLLLVNRKGEIAAGTFQLADLLNMKRPTLYSVLRRLEKNEIITLRPNPKYTIVQITNWSKYQASDNRGRVTSAADYATPDATAEQQRLMDDSSTTVATRSVAERQQHGNSTATARQHSNNNKNDKKNENNPIIDAAVATADVAAEKTKATPSKDIDACFNKWKEIVGHSITNSDRNRKAASNLLKMHGPDRFERLLHGVAATLQDRYAPRIADFAALQRKQDELILWGRKRGHHDKVAEF